MKILGLILAAAIVAEARTWTDAETGRTVEAEMVGRSGDRVQLRRSDGRTFDLPLAQLSEADRAFVAAAGDAADWPSWRGPNRDGRSPDTGLLKEWPEGGPKLLWSFENAGAGYSAPAVVGGMIYFTGARDGEAEVICLDASGKEQWSAPIGDDPGKGYNTGWGGGPRGAPTLSEGLLYAMNANGDVACIDINGGKVKWRKSLVDDFGGGVPAWGYSETPLVDGDKVLVTPGGGGGAIVALDRQTGEVIWRSKDLTEDAQYSSIVIAEAGGKRQYVQLFMKKFAGVDAATGELLWTSDWSQGRTAVIPTPVVRGNRVYITAGYGAGCKLVEIDGDSAEEVWENKVMKNHHGGVILVDGHLYGFSDGAGLVCQDFKTGERVWSQKGENLEKGAVHYADGMLYCLDERNGSVFLVEATPEEYREKGRFGMPGKTKLRDDNQGKVWTHPVVIGGRLYLRDQDLFFCFDVKG